LIGATLRNVTPDLHVVLPCSHEDRSRDRCDATQLRRRCDIETRRAPAYSDARRAVRSRGVIARAPEAGACSRSAEVVRMADLETQMQRSAATLPRAGSEFGGTARFRVIARLGSGSGGMVYEVHDRERNDAVALKILHVVSAEALARFKHEFRSLVDLHHPNLVRVGELIEDRGVWFFTMELVRGRHFLDHVRRDPRTIGDARAREADSPTSPLLATAASPAVPATRSPARFDERRLRACLVQLAQGLAALHLAHKVHRDIKSSNVLVTDDGRVVVVDFGAAIEAAIEAAHPGPLAAWRDGPVNGRRPVSAW
jgi:serine/threonine protein kinase